MLLERETMDLRISGNSYLVVGGTAGMGLAAAQVLTSNGASVGIVGRDAERASLAPERIGSDAVQVIIGDINQEGEAERIVAAGVAAFGGLNGIAVTTGTNPESMSTLEGSADSTWAGACSDVLMGPVRAVRAAIPHVIESGLGGTIVTTSSYAISAYYPDRMPYIVMKTGLASFTKIVAKEYGRYGIRANCVCPGAIETEALAAVRQQVAEARGVAPEGVLEQMMVEEWHMNVGLGRLGRPEEVGELFAFLLSPRAGYLSGAVINIDGGTDF